MQVIVVSLTNFEQMWIIFRSIIGLSNFFFVPVNFYIGSLVTHFIKFN